MTTLSRLALILAISLSTAARAASVRAAARLSYASGAVTVETKAGKHDGKIGEALSDGDAVATGSRATAIVTLADGSRLKLRETSRLVLTLPTKRSPVTEILLSLGGIFAQVTKQKAGREFHVRTATSVAAVRGTRFFTALGRERSGSHDVSICVNEGAVDITTDKVKKPVTCPQGMGVLVKSGLDPDKPKVVAWTKKLNWNMDPKAGETKDSTQMSDWSDEDEGQ